MIYSVGAGLVFVLDEINWHNPAEPRERETPVSVVFPQDRDAPVILQHGSS